LKPWHVYVLRCADGTLYTGITNDLDKRIKAHNEGHGARYTRSRRPVEVVYSEPAESRSAATLREAEIKRMPRRRKVAMIAASQARHVLTILAVSDLARSRRFYEEAFGWPIRVVVPVYVEFGLPGGNGLGLYAREGFARNTGLPPAIVPAGAITGTELYLHCPDPRTLSTKLEAAGARVLSALAPRDWGDEAVYFADPDGNVIVVACRA
jgi:predicted GIY-YIG superfamily endonuclease/catechol 2,3-dioxygenase-like lactoylglutathione lyase family enzyme